MDVINLKVDEVLEQIHDHAVFELKKPLMAENDQRIIDKYAQSLWVPIFFTVHVSPAWLQKKQITKDPIKQINQEILRLFQKYGVIIRKGVIAVELGSARESTFSVSQYESKDTDILSMQKSIMEPSDFNRLIKQQNNPHIHGYILLRKACGCLERLRMAIEQVDCPLDRGEEYFNRRFPIKSTATEKGKAIIRTIRERELKKHKYNTKRKVDIRVAYKLKNDPNKLMDYIQKDRSANMLDFCSIFVLKK